MKLRLFSKIGFILGLLLLVISSFNQQSQNVIINEDSHLIPVPQTVYAWNEQWSGLKSDLKDVYFINETHGWICSKNGFLLKTEDAGLNWTIVNLTQQLTTGVDSISELNFIQFYKNGQIGFACGYDGHIIKSIDYGKTWRTVSNNSDWGSVLYSLFFLNDTHGWAVGANGHLETTDGGESWFRNINNSYDGRAVFFFNSTHGYRSSGPRFYKTTNGGQNWTQIAYFSGWQDNVGAFHFLSWEQGWVAHRLTISFTNNGGQTWTNKSYPVLVPEEMYMFNASHGIVVGDKIGITSDGGINWTEESWDADRTSHLKGMAALLVAGVPKIWAVGVVPASITEKPPYWGFILSTEPAGIPPTKDGYPQPLNTGANMISSDHNGQKFLDMAITTTQPIWAELSYMNEAPAAAQNVPPNATFFFSISVENISYVQFPVTIKLYYNENTLKIPENQLCVYWFNTTSWAFVNLGGTVFPDQNYIEIALTHFSTFGLGQTDGTVQSSIGSTTSTSTTSTSTSTSQTNTTTSTGLLNLPTLDPFNNISGIAGYSSSIILSTIFLAGIIFIYRNRKLNLK
jgi:photosystem II stability/assembly factor-like uncharacterized protein